MISHLDWTVYNEYLSFIRLRDETVYTLQGKLLSKVFPVFKKNYFKIMLFAKNWKKSGQNGEFKFASQISFNLLNTINPSDTI